MLHDVVVCVHNGHDDVENCLESLISNWNNGLQRLIIVDDQSDAAMVSTLSKFAEGRDFVTIIRLNEQHYYTKAANKGLSESSADICTLLNSDTIVTQGWDQRIRATFKAFPQIGIVGPLSNAASTQSLPFVKSSANQTAINSLPPGVSIDEFAAFVSKEAAGQTFPFVPLVHGFCLSISRKVIETIGYFDEESFPRGYGEENDYCFRAEDAGFILAIAIDTFVYHVKSKSYSTQDRIAFMNAGSKMFAQKHGSERIRQAIQYMESNPHLQTMRNAVLAKWPTHYGGLDG
ncbi:glycosyltransferase family 2 protein [Rhizobium sp. SYY.PMSO]|uniref:glycosyltransferase family 2 protein n=1 Tax=Rhizobium sp. SYY.PMSO TaxID=3382192 RepID=UPI00398F9B7F